MAKKLTLEDFVQKARQVHKDRYDYTESVYVNSATPIEIRCSKHGIFKQLTTNHLAGKGCRACRDESRRFTAEQFIERASEVHKNFYSYPGIVYHNNRTPIDIVCPVHGVFKQTPAAHMQGVGCPPCGNLRKSHSQVSFLEAAKGVHGDLYDYSRVEYKGSGRKITITCKKHGDFQLRASNHLTGQGCPTCAKEQNTARKWRDISHFRLLAEKTHGTRYCYDNTVYKGTGAKLSIVCEKHGEFTQKAGGHLLGRGCPVCAKRCSGGEKALLEFIREISPNMEVESQAYINPPGYGKYFLDVLVPSKGVAFEYNGLYWHSEVRKPWRYYHIRKTEASKAAGYSLVHIFEDDWVNRRHQVEHLIRYKLGLLPAVMARKMKIILVGAEAAKSFYATYHIQGASRQANQTHYGLVDSEGLVAVMSFSQAASKRVVLGDGAWELVRFASKYRVQGGASRLFTAFLRDTKPSSVLSYSLNHLFSGAMYEALGFQLEKELPPDYSYILPNRTERLHKSGFQKSKLKRRLGVRFNPQKTEHENCKDNHIYRVYDAGKKRWVWSG